MAPTAPAVPARIGIGVRVKTRKEPCRTGTVQATTGQRQWMVLFDGQDEVEAASSNQLQIYLEAYGQRQGTPPPSPSRNISQTTKPTGRKAARALRDRGNEQISYAENRSDDDDDGDDDDNESQQSGFTIDSSNLDTPRAEPSTQNRGRRRAVGTPTDLFSHGSTTPSDDDSAADSTDENYFHAAAKKRRCSMNAEGCKSTGADVRNECSHRSCLAKINGPANRFGSTTGVFICDNNACRWKHWKEVFESAQSLAPVQRQSS